MVQALLDVVIGPLLVLASTLACRRWGERLGGVVSAFPAVIGPVLLITAQNRGAHFTARTANATLLGLVALSGFVLVYAQLARRTDWPLSLTAGWVCSAAISGLIGWWAASLPFPAGLAAAALSLLAVYRLIPRPRSPVALQSARGGRELPGRMAITALLIAGLGAAAELAGPVAGGMLAALPALASVLAVLTHRRQGSDALLALLAGMVLGMASFVTFCAAIALLIVPVGTAAAFAAATAGAAVIQLALFLGARSRRPALQAARS